MGADENKVVPITGKHTTLSSMMAQCMADPKALRGFVVFFDADGTMNFGELGVTRSDICMAAAYLNMLAVEMMRQSDN
jgi:hypothetical protein